MIELNSVICADAIEVLRQIEPDTVDAIITDPPYSSGGIHSTERKQPTSRKYIEKSTLNQYYKLDFSGDNRDQRSWVSYTAYWLSLCYNCTKPGAVIAVFTDWRQLPSLSDAMQWAQWIWRGCIVWNKTNSRPQKGRPRQQCEFILWGSKNKLPLSRNASTLPGLYTFSAPAHATRRHQTEKPLDLMRNLIHICEKGGTVLDPFAGSGTTLLAAIYEGYKYIGVEINRDYYDIIMQRISCHTERSPNL